MRRSCFIALAAVFLASSSGATHLFERNPSPAVIRLATQRKAVQDPVNRDALHRRQTVTQTLDNGVSSYPHMQAIREIGSLERWYHLAF